MSNNAPTPEAAQTLPQNLETPSVDVLNKTVELFHDETTFQACDYECTLWEAKGDHMLLPKSRGAEIIVSEKRMHGYLQLSDAGEFEAAKQKFPEITEPKARAYLE